MWPRCKQSRPHNCRVFHYHSSEVFRLYAHLHKQNVIAWHTPTQQYEEAFTSFFFLVAECAVLNSCEHHNNLWFAYNASFDDCEKHRDRLSTIVAFLQERARPEGKLWILRPVHVAAQELHAPSRPIQIQDDTPAFKGLRGKDNRHPARDTVRAATIGAISSGHEAEKEGRPHGYYPAFSGLSSFFSPVGQLVHTYRSYVLDWNQSCQPWAPTPGCRFSFGLTWESKYFFVLSEGFWTFLMQWSCYGCL